MADTIPKMIRAFPGDWEKLEEFRQRMQEAQPIGWVRQAEALKELLRIAAEVQGKPAPADERQKAA